MTQLYVLTGQYKELQTMDFDPVVIKDTLDGIKSEIQEKAKNISYINANMTARIGAIDLEIKRLQAMKKVEQNKQDALKDYLRTNMQECEIDKIECDLFTITLKKAGVKLNPYDVELTPSEYKTEVTTTVINNKAILDDLKSGKEVPGYQLQDAQRGLMIK